MKLRIYLKEKIRTNRYGLTGIERHAASNLLLLEEKGSTRLLEVLDFMPIKRRGDVMIESERSHSSIRNTLGGKPVMSLVDGVTKQFEVLNKININFKHFDSRSF